jgi:beta-lactam-binding protein with PASTA domain
MTIKPISPNEISEKKKQSFPDAVLEAFNEIIAQNYSNGQSIVKQEDVVKLMVKKGVKRADIFGMHYLDIEPVYEAQGWKVEYDKPGYNETYDANFTFKKKSRG